MGRIVLSSVVAVLLASSVLWAKEAERGHGGRDERPSTEDYCERGDWQRDCRDDGRYNSLSHTDNYCREHRLHHQLNNTREVIRYDAYGKHVERHIITPYAHHRNSHHHIGHRVERLDNAFYFLMGGLTYYFLDGIFYRPYDRGGYIVSTAPIGAIIYTLPRGYVTYQFGGRKYYHYNEVYYTWDEPRRGYRVVERPSHYDDPFAAGSIHKHLPNGAKRVYIDGISYYDYDGIYFLSVIQNGKRVYKVVEVN